MARHDQFWFCFSLAEKVAQILVTNHRVYIVKQSKREITFNTQSFLSETKAVFPYIRKLQEGKNGDMLVQTDCD